MGLFDNLLNMASGEDRDLGAIRRAITALKRRKQAAAAASEAERKEVEEALAFLRQEEEKAK